jgi:hypothetical protein
MHRQRSCAQHSVRDLILLMLPLHFLLFRCLSHQSSDSPNRWPSCCRNANNCGCLFFGLFACMKRDLHQRAIRQPFSCSLSLSLRRDLMRLQKKTRQASGSSSILSISRFRPQLTSASSQDLSPFGAVFVQQKKRNVNNGL